MTKIENDYFGSSCGGGGALQAPQEPETHYICGKGPGYTLNAAALRMFNGLLYPECSVNDVAGEGDRTLSLCFWNYGIRCSRGYEINFGKRGGQRYHLLDAEAEVREVAQYKKQWRKLKRRFGIPFQRAIAAVANDSFAFSMNGGREEDSSEVMLKMQRYEAFLYDLC